MRFQTELVLRTWLAAAALAVAGCATPPPPAPPPPAPAPAPEPPPMAAPPPAPEPDPAALADAATRRLLAFHDRIRELPPADVAREQARLGDPPDGPAGTLELALLLGQGRNPGDLARAISLVEPLTRTGAPPATLSIARLVYVKLLDQRRLEEQFERLNAQIRDQQRRIDQLSSQLEALKAIERSLNNPRPTPGASTSKPPP